MAARPWFRLRSTIGQAPPPPQAPSQPPTRPDVQSEPPAPPQPPRPGFGRALTFRPTMVAPPPPPSQPATPPPPPPPRPEMTPPPPPRREMTPPPPSPPPRREMTPPSPTPAKRTPTPSPPSPVAPFPEVLPKSLTPSPKTPIMASFQSAPPSSPSTRSPPPPASISKTLEPGVSAPGTSVAPQELHSSISELLARTRIHPSMIPPLEQTPPHSPYKSKAPTPVHPPSPLALPPSHYPLNHGFNETKITEAVKETVVQENVDNPKVPNFFQAFKNNGSASITTNNNAPKPIVNARAEKPEVITKHWGRKERITKSTRKGSASESEEGGMRIITIAGDNKGAIMDLGKLSPSWTNHGHHYELLKKNKSKDHDGSDGSSKEGKGKNKHKETGKSQNAADKPLRAFMNSNVQAINNSILLDASCTHHDPGIHLKFSRKTAGGGYRYGFKHNGHDPGHPSG